MGERDLALLARWYQLSRALSDARDQLELARPGASDDQACVALQLRIRQLAHDLRQAQEAIEAARAGQ